MFGESRGGLVDMVSGGLKFQFQHPLASGTDG